MAGFSDPVLGEEAALAQAMLMRDLMRARLVKTIPIATPAAGSGFSVTVPGGVIWEVLSVSFNLVTSATVATRISGILYLDPDGNIKGGGSEVSGQGASTNVNYTFARNMGDHGIAVAAGAVGPLSEAYLPSGNVVESIHNSLQAGDIISGVSVTVREWSEWGIAYNVQYVAEQIAAVQR